MPGRSAVGALDAGVPQAGDDEPDVVPTLDEDLGLDLGLDLDSDLARDLGRAAAGDEAAGDGDAGAVTARGPLVDLPGGTTFGVLVHEALEAIDLSLDPAEATVALREQLTDRALQAGIPVDVERVADGLVLALDTPLDPIAPGVRLRDVAAADRIPELVFELPVADTHARVTLAALADAVSGALAEDDPYRGAFATLAGRLVRARFAGWLTGVVDLALRTPDGRYVVADYKSNRLSGADGLPAYDAAAMHAAMLHGEYPLQALLYLVGLHRILGRRLAGYDPDVHLGGAAFLFVRGMVGADTPLRDGVRDGVCVWRPRTAAVLAADAVLRGGAR
jgi:exodeoxyribonuclease V beta subunit